MLTPTTPIDVAHWRLLPPYEFRGTLDRAIQTCPHTDADERLAMLCEGYGIDTATLPESHIWGTESHLHRLCDAGVPDEDVIRYVLDCQSVVLLDHDCETWRRLSWNENSAMVDGKMIYGLDVTVEEWTGEWDDEWVPLDDSEELPAGADWEAPEDRLRAEDSLLSRLGLTRDDLTDETRYL